MKKSLMRLISAFKLILLFSFGNTVADTAATPAATVTANSVRTIHHLNSPFATVDEKGALKDPLQKIIAPFPCSLKAGTDQYIGIGTSGTTTVGLSKVAKKMQLELVGITSTTITDINAFSNNCILSYVDDKDKQTYYLSTDGTALSFTAGTAATISWMAIANPATPYSFMLVSKDLNPVPTLSGWVVVKGADGISLTIKKHTDTIADTEKVYFSIIRQGNFLGVTGPAETDSQKTADRLASYLAAVQAGVGRINYVNQEGSKAFFEAPVTKILLIGAAVGVFPQDLDALLPAGDGDPQQTTEILSKLDPSLVAASGTPPVTTILPLGLESDFNSTLAFATEMYKDCQDPTVTTLVASVPGFAQFIGATITKLVEQIQDPLNSNGELESNVNYKNPAEDPTKPASLIGIQTWMQTTFKYKSTSDATNFDAYLAAVDEINQDPDDQTYVIGQISGKDFSISRTEAQVILLATSAKIGISQPTLDPDTTPLDLTKIVPTTITGMALINLLSGTGFVKKTAAAKGATPTATIGTIPSGFLNMDTKSKLVAQLSDLFDLTKNPTIVNAVNVGRQGLGSTIRTLITDLYNDADLRRAKGTDGTVPIVTLKAFIDKTFQSKVIANFYDELKDIDQRFLVVKTSDDAKSWITDLQKDFTKRLESLAASLDVADNDISRYIKDFSGASVVAPLVFLRYKTDNLTQITAYSVFAATQLDGGTKAIDEAYSLAQQLMQDLTLDEALTYIKGMFQGSGSLSAIQANIFKNTLQVLCSSPTVTPTSVTYNANSSLITGRLGLRPNDISTFKALIKQYEDLTNGGKPADGTDTFGACVTAVKTTPLKVFETEFVPVILQNIQNFLMKDPTTSVVWDAAPQFVVPKPSIHQLSIGLNYDINSFWTDFCDNGYKIWEQMKLIDWTKPEHIEPVNAVINFICDSIESMSPTDQKTYDATHTAALAELTRIKGVRNTVQAAIATPITSMTSEQMLQRMQSVTNKILVSAKDVQDFMAIVAALSDPDKFKDLTTAQKAVYAECLTRAKVNQVFPSSIANRLGGKVSVNNSGEAWSDLLNTLSGSAGGVKVALLWTDPSDATKKYALKLLTLSGAPTTGAAAPTAASAPTVIRLLNDDYLDDSCHFEFITESQTPAGDVVTIKSKDGKYFVVTADGSDMESVTALPTDNPDKANFLKAKIGTTEARAFQNKFTGGFLTVRQAATDPQKAGIETAYPGKLYASVTTKIGDSPAGLLNSDGTISPNNMSSFSFVQITKLHQDLLAIKNTYANISTLETNIPQKDTLYSTTVAQFVQVITDLQSTSQAIPDNLVLVASIFKSFIELCAKQTTSQWKWFTVTKDTDGQTYQQHATNVASIITKCGGSDTGVAAAVADLTKSISNPVTQSPQETALLPDNNAIINISISIGGVTKYLKTYSERIGDGSTGIFIRADCTDPMDPDAQFQFAITDGQCTFSKNTTQLAITSSPTTINPKWNATTIKQQERVKLLTLDPKGQGAQQLFAMEPSAVGDFATTNFFITNLSDVGGVWQIDSSGYLCSMVNNPTTGTLDPIAKDANSTQQQFKYQVTSKLVSQLDTSNPLATITNLVSMVQDVSGTDNKESTLSTILNTTSKFIQKLQADQKAWATAICNNQILAQFENFFALAAAVITGNPAPAITAAPAASTTAGGTSAAATPAQAPVQPTSGATTPLSNTIKIQFRSTLNLYLGITDQEDLNSLTETFNISNISWTDPNGVKQYLVANGTTLEFRPLATPATAKTDTAAAGTTAAGATPPTTPTADPSDPSAQFILTITQGDPTLNAIPSQLSVTISNGTGTAATALAITADSTGEKSLALGAASAATTLIAYGPVLNMILCAQNQSDPSLGYIEVDPETSGLYANDAVDHTLAIPLARASHFRVDQLDTFKIQMLGLRVKDKTATQDQIKTSLAAMSKLFTQASPDPKQLATVYDEFDKILNLFLTGTVQSDEGIFNTFKQNNNDAITYLFQGFARVYKTLAATDKDTYTKKSDTLTKLQAAWGFGFRIETPGMLKTGDKILLQSSLTGKFVVAQDATIEKNAVSYLDATSDDPLAAVQLVIAELNGRYAFQYTNNGNNYVLSTKLSSLLAANQSAIDAYKKQLSRAILVPQPKDWALSSANSSLEQFTMTQNSDGTISIRAVYQQGPNGFVENPLTAGFITTATLDYDQGFLRANNFQDGTMLPQALGADKVTPDPSQTFAMTVLADQTADVFNQLTQAAQKNSAGDKITIYQSLVQLTTTSETILLLTQELKTLIKANLAIDDKTWSSFVQTYSDPIQQIAKALDQRLPNNKIFSDINLLLQEQYQDNNNGTFAIQVTFDDGTSKFLECTNDTTVDDGTIRLFLQATGMDKINPAGSFTTNIQGLPETGQTLSIQVMNGVDALVAAAKAKTPTVDSAFLAVETSTDASQEITAQPDSLNTLTAAKMFTFVPVSGRKFNITSGANALAIGSDYTLCFGTPDTPLAMKITNLEFVPLSASEADYARIEGLSMESAISEFTRKIKTITTKSKQADQDLLIQRVSKFIQGLTQITDPAQKAIITTKQNDINTMITNLTTSLGDKYKDQIAKLLQVWNAQSSGPKNGDIVLIQSTANNNYLQLMQDPQSTAIYLQAVTTDPVLATRLNVYRNMSTVWFSIKDATGKELFLQTNTPDLTGINIPSVVQAKSRMSFGTDQTIMKFQINSEGTAFSLKGVSTKDKMGNLIELGDPGFMTADSTDSYFVRMFSTTASAIPKESPILPARTYSFTTVYGTTGTTLDQIAAARKKTDPNDQLTILSTLVDQVTLASDGALVANEVTSIITTAQNAGTAAWQKFKDYSAVNVTAIGTKYDTKFGTTESASWANLLTQAAGKTDRVCVLPDAQEIVLISTNNNKLLRVTKESVVKNNYLFLTADADDMTQATIFKTVQLSIDDGTGNISDFYGLMSEDDIASGLFLTNAVINVTTDLATAKNAFTRLNLVPNTRDVFLKADDPSKCQQFIVTKSTDGTSYTFKSAFISNASSTRPVANTASSAILTVDTANGNFMKVYDDTGAPLTAATDLTTQTFQVFSVDKNASDFLKSLKSLLNEKAVDKRMNGYITAIQSANTVTLANLLLRHVIAFITANKTDAVTWTAFNTLGAALTTQFVTAFTTTFGTTAGLETVDGINALISSPFTQALANGKYALRAIINNQPSATWFQMVDDPTNYTSDILNTLGLTQYTKLLVPTLSAKDKLLPQALFNITISADNNSITIFSDYDKADVLTNPNASGGNFDTMALTDTIMSVVAVGASTTRPAGAASQINIVPVQGLQFKFKSGLSNNFYFVGTDLETPSQMNKIQSKFADQTPCTEDTASVFEFVAFSDQEVATVATRSESLTQRVREYANKASAIDLTTAKDARESFFTEIENLVASFSTDDTLKAQAVTIYGQISDLITSMADPKRIATYKAVQDRAAALKTSLQTVMSPGLSADSKVFLMVNGIPLVPFDLPTGGSATESVLKATPGANIFDDSILLTTQANGPLISFISGGDKTLVANTLDPKAFPKYPKAKKAIVTALYFVATTDMAKDALALFKSIDLGSGLTGFSESTTLGFITYCPTDSLLRVFNPDTQAPFVQAQGSLTSANQFSFIICDDFYNGAKTLATPVAANDPAQIASTNTKLQGFKDLLLQTTVDNKGHQAIYLQALTQAFTGQAGYYLNMGLLDVLAKATDTWSLAATDPTVVGIKAIATQAIPIGLAYSQDLVNILTAGPDSSTTPDAWFSTINKNVLTKWSDSMTSDKAFKSITDAQVLNFMNSSSKSTKKLQASDLSNAAIVKQVRMARYQMLSQDMLQSCIKALQGIIPKTGETPKIPLSAANMATVQSTAKAMSTASAATLKKRSTVK